VSKKKRKKMTISVIQDDDRGSKFNNKGGETQFLPICKKKNNVQANFWTFVLYLFNSKDPPIAFDDSQNDQPNFGRINNKSKVKNTFQSCIECFAP
jgi:hypothetical protein